MLKIVLASKSPRRKKLLNQLGLIFEIIPSTKEEIITSNNPVDIVSDLSLQKAVDISQRVANSFVIGADTIVVKDGVILGKPEDASDAISMLSELSGTVHSVFTGVSFVLTNDQKEIISRYSFFEETKVWFSTLSDSDIRSYVASGSPMDKAGSYGIQDDWGSVFVERIEGDYYNVVGFPLNRFYRELEKFHPDLLNLVVIPHHSS
ncbi:MAG: septum formation protein Maf [Balneolaceae bacterium]|nr:septum formation protein Maf [Balneolaceae bacterium]MBO6547774.1 septum formation protein Maf [Balneolaceae bacterium]MBO6648285.1 septum formation protein Maf [Balneolaceae bacterium]